MSKIVVTGAAGFIGGETLLKLVDTGHDVLAIDREMPPGHLIPVPCQWHTLRRYCAGLADSPVADSHGTKPQTVPSRAAAGAPTPKAKPKRRAKQCVDQR